MLPVRMSGVAEAPDHFRTWVQARSGRCDPGAFLPRRLYGEYLRALLDGAVRGRARGVELRRICGQVVALAVHGGGTRLTLDDGRSHEGGWGKAFDNLERVLA